MQTNFRTEDSNRLKDFKKKIELSHKYYSTTGVATSYTEVISLSIFPTNTV